MEAWVWIVLAVIVVVVVAVALWMASRGRRRQQLQQRFGPEYDRTVEEAGDRRSAEADLLERQKRREELEIRPLSPGARDRYIASWSDTQARFVDDPTGAVGEADRLVQEVMRERGYPVDDFEQRATDVSVDHPGVVSDYRAAHEISSASGRGDATTEDLRKAMVHYRSLFDELLETRTDG